MSKYDKLYSILKCPQDLEIPLNDLDAWKKYPYYRWVYNRLEISEFQNVLNAPLPIKPEKYPVIIKPIINLYGMGLNIQKIDNENQFDDIWYNNNFWMEYFEGEHYSYDLIILNGEIQYHICFHGIKNDEYDGCFCYWVSIKTEIPKIINKLVNEKMSGYTGCMNIEMIGNHIIECHLRMGDIDIFPTHDILNGIIATYQNQKYDWDKINVKEVYFIPLWIEGKYTEKLRKFLKKKIEQKLGENKYIHEYGIDETTLCGPSKCKRILHFTCSDKNYGFSILNSIKNIIKDNFNVDFI
jgi:hypothetical protein